jgi:hypothetical protein
MGDNLFDWLDETRSLPKFLARLFVFSFVATFLCVLIVVVLIWIWQINMFGIIFVLSLLLLSTVIYAFKKEKVDD